MYIKEREIRQTDEDLTEATEIMIRDKDINVILHYKHGTCSHDNACLWQVFNYFTY
jgi:hypothetical protein